MPKGKEKEQWADRERIKADRTASGKIKIYFFSKKATVNLTDSQYDEIADLYEKCLRIENKLRKLMREIKVVSGEKPSSWNIFRYQEWNKKNTEHALLGKEWARYSRKRFGLMDEIEKKLDPYFSDLKIYHEKKKKYFGELENFEKWVNEVLEEGKNSGLIGDLEEVEELEDQSKNPSFSENSGGSNEEIRPEKIIETVLGTMEAVCFFAGLAMGKDLTGTGPIREEVGSSSHYKQTELIISPPPSPPGDW